MDYTEDGSSPSNPHNSVDYVHDVEETEDEDDDRNEKAIVLLEDTDDDSDMQNGYNTEAVQEAGLPKEKQKKRKLEALLSKYEFAPRAVETPPVARSSHGGRNSLTDWTEVESFALLDAWGEAYEKSGRKSVSSVEWHEVAVKVSAKSRFHRTETQCRNRLDTLKKKYKKEKREQVGKEDFVSKCVYFSKMDMLISPKQGNGGTSNCPGSGFGNGSLVAYVHPVSAYSSEEVKDNEVNDDEAKDDEVEDSEAKDDEGEDNEVKDDAVGDDVVEISKPEIGNDNVLPKKKRRVSEKDVGEGLKLLADSIEKFSTIYEKMETSKMNQMAEFEKMRMEFRQDLEVQRAKMLKQNQVAIANIWGVTLEDNDNDNNTSG